MRDDVFYFFLLILVPALVIIGFGLALGIAIDYADCHGFESATGRETKWRWGCYVKVADQWVPKEYVFGDAHEFRIKNDR